MALLELTDLTKSYVDPDGRSRLILDIPMFALDERQQVALAGSSGCGKTTFLNIIAGILRADGGRVLFDTQDLSQLGEGERDALRAREMGYVFQTFNLLEGYTALENVLLGMLFGPGPDRERAYTLLERLGLGGKQEHRPSQLSVGQQQRVALARALANKPRLVLADEPTGNLDPVHAREALVVIRELCDEQDTALLLVSHDPVILGSFDKVLEFSELNRALSSTERQA
jgi:putative ABC transport system ATP-binding protein